MSKNIIMSDEKTEINKSIKNRGFNIIESVNIEGILPFERRHADIQCLKINDTFFVLKEAQKLKEKLFSLQLKVIEIDEEIGANYPQNILLNAVYMNNKLYCKADSVAKAVIKHCNANNIEIFNVNQGYTKCSTAVFENCFITADKGIFDTLSRNGEEGLLIDSGDIELDGVDYGFIGGCTFYNNGKAYFTGDITQHKNYKLIKDFLTERNIKIVCLTNKKLYDIGGFIVI
ncbi:MAG: hypothetical protein IJT79_02010 [Ruminococcus sp.]|nr:hypothetical protein [Ruminococcus sp.]